jgi:NAD(P)-dependent dehydrogenase (short-subunit alcohol dehydrogenase family)
MSAVVLITGASTGFGRDAAERLARRGHQVFAAMRDIIVPELAGVPRIAAVGG